MKIHRLKSDFRGVSSAVAIMRLELFYVDRHLPTPPATEI